MEVQSFSTLVHYLIKLPNKALKLNFGCHYTVVYNSIALFFYILFDVVCFNSTKK
jgi:hypothetical protein